MFSIMIIIGTRPEITKMAPIIRKVKQFDMKLVLIHSGQHYNTQMSQVFLDDLKINEITENLNVGSDSHGAQTARMLEKYEKVVIKYQPDIVLALGDTNSVAAASFICSKLNIPFGHVEAGIRSFDLTMPEEINRRFAGVGASIHFAPTEQAVLNLYYEGIDPSRIYLTGHTVVDATIEHAIIAKQKSNILKKLKIPKGKPLISATVHRAGNTDNKENLTNIVEAFISLENFTIIFPVHPRTRKRLDEYGLYKKLNDCQHVILTEPMGYLDFLQLMQNSVLIMTDSGGLQEEALILKKPCITLRTNTERPETVKLGVNFLVGSDTKEIIRTVNRTIKSDEIKNRVCNAINPYGDGNASTNILKIIQNRLKNQNLKFKSPSFLLKGAIDYRLVQISETISLSDFEEKYKGKVTLVYDNKGFPSKILSEIPAGWFVRIQY